MQQRPPADARRPLRLAILAVLVAGLGAVLYVGVESFRAQRLNFVAPLPSDLLRHPDAVGISRLEAVTFPGAGGARITGWFVPPQNRATILLLHGTSADRTSMLPEARLLANARFGLLAFDWPGFGESEGEVRWGSGERAALQGAIDWVTRRPDVDPNRVGALGFSMGGFMLAQVAAQDTRLKALVFAATPTDMRDQVIWESRRWGPFSRAPALLALSLSGMPLGDVSPEGCIAQIAPRPVLVFGGDADPTVPLPMTKALYEAARDPKELWLVPGAHHGGYDTSAPDYSTRILQFFTHALKPTGST
jgi:dipeptidyl aminopeptidase/acylaminoacyl peptidase